MSRTKTTLIGGKETKKCSVMSADEEASPYINKNKISSMLRKSVELTPTTSKPILIPTTSKNKGKKTELETNVSPFSQFTPKVTAYLAKYKDVSGNKLQKAGNKFSRLYTNIIATRKEDAIKKCSTTLFKVAEENGRNSNIGTASTQKRNVAKAIGKKSGSLDTISILDQGTHKKRRSECDKVKYTSITSRPSTVASTALKTARTGGTITTPKGKTMATARPMTRDSSLEERKKQEVVKKTQNIKQKQLMAQISQGLALDKRKVKVLVSSTDTHTQQQQNGTQQKMISSKYVTDKKTINIRVCIKPKT